MDAIPSSGVLQIFGAGTSLLAGYAFIRFSPYRHYSVSGLRTDRFALHVLGWSLALYIFGELSVRLFEWLPVWWPSANQRLVEFRDVFTSGMIPAPVFYALLFSWPLTLLDRLIVLTRMRGTPELNIAADQSFWYRTNVAAIGLYVAKSTDATLRILYRAVFLQKFIMVTLQNGKVYVGNPVLPALDPTTLGTSLRLVPYLSGCRDAASQKVNFTTRYDDLFARIKYENDEEQGENQRPSFRASALHSEPALLTLRSKEELQIDAEDIGIVIMLSEVQALTFFDPRIYQFFQDQGPQQQQPVTDSNSTSAA